MAINVYEGMFIFDSGRYGRDPEGVSGAITKMVQDAGGEILVSRLWEERRLAYPINGQKKGTYWLTYFRIEGSQIPTLTRQSDLNESILRCLMLKVDPRIVDALVAHATGAVEAAPEAEGEAATPAAEGEAAAETATAVAEAPETTETPAAEE